MQNLNNQGEKLKQSAIYIKTLQKEVSEFKEKINNLEFELSTLRFLEQYVQYEVPKQDEMSEDREKERLEYQQKVIKMQKEISELKDSNTEFLQQIKVKEQQKLEIAEKWKNDLAKKQQELESCQADLETKIKELEILKNKEKDDYEIIHEGSASNSPINEKKIHDLQKMQMENLRLKIEIQNQKKELENNRSAFNDLVKQMHKQEEDKEQSVRDWKQKYDEIARLFDQEKENLQSQLEEKGKVVANLQQKLYQIQNKSCNKETQTQFSVRQREIKPLQLLKNATFGEENDQIDTLDNTLNVIKNSSVEYIIQLSYRNGYENELLGEICRIVEEIKAQKPKYCEIEIERLKRQCYFLEKLFTNLYKKWKSEKEKKTAISQNLAFKRFVSVPTRLDEYDAQQKVQDAQRNLIYRLKIKYNESKVIISRLEGQIVQIQENFKLQLDSKQKEKDSLIKSSQKLNEDLQKVTELKQKFKLENDSLMKDLESTFEKMQKKEEIIIDLKQKIEEKNSEIKQLELNIKKQNETEVQELQQKLQQKEKTLEDLQSTIENLNEQNKQLEMENFELQQDNEKLYNKCGDSKSTGAKKQKTYIYKGAYQT